MHPEASYESLAQPGTPPRCTKNQTPQGPLGLNGLDEKHAVDENTLTCLCLILAGKQAAAGI